MERRLLIITALVLFNFESLHAQVMLKEIPLKQQIENASLVIEGKVISKKSFWDAEHKNIYTVNTIEAFKVFKGDVVNNVVEVITLGGTVGFDALMAFPNLKLREGDIGMFILYYSNIALSPIAKTQNKQFIVYSSSQGFYKYNLKQDVAINPFNKTQGITSLFYNTISDLTKSVYIEVAKIDINAMHIKLSQSNKALAPSIADFAPIMASAGTKTVLTINGSGFGGSKGKVSFRNADDGGATYTDALDSQVLTWGDAQIKVEIPAEAGTGTIQVTDATTNSIESLSDLTISYSEINLPYDPDNSTGPLGLYAYQTRLVEDNGSGGYTWEMQTDFFNDTEFPGAKSAFEKVLDQWRCATGVNWTISNLATTVDVLGNDEVNVVRFDNPGENDLGVGELGKCIYWISGCGIIGTPESWNFHVVELDIVFDSGTNWFFGTTLPSFSKFDFESVALHELGHGHQLGHVIDTSPDGDNMDDVMYYAISNGEQQRVLNTSNLTAANEVQSRSTTIVACSRSVMTNHPCYLSIDEEELKEAISMYPNPTNGSFNIKNESLINLEKVEIYDISGRLISTYDFTNSSRIKTINLLGVSKGMYFINIYSERAMITKKLILE